MKVTAEQFIEVWMQAAREDRNAYWVASQLGLQHQAVYQRANYMRQRGVKLPKLSRYNKKRLNNLISDRKDKQ